MINKISLTLALGMVGLLAACSVGDEQMSHSIDLEVKGRQLVGEAVIQVKNGDSVSLNWSVDESATIHLHGYDIIRTIEPGQTVAFEFTAESEGRFKIEAHSFAASESRDEGDGDAGADEGHDDESHDEGGVHGSNGDSDVVTLGYLEVRPR